MISSILTKLTFVDRAFRGAKFVMLGVESMVANTGQVQPVAILARFPFAVGIKTGSKMRTLVCDVVAPFTRRH
jgi:hypothetical protein